MIIDLGFLVQSIMRFGFGFSAFYSDLGSDADGNEVDKLIEKLQGVGIASGSADGAVLTTSKCRMSDDGATLAAKTLGLPGLNSA
ncbi:hypothetical protein C5167_048048 [Papaver somniferum]|uniref:Uncharacterized protein n=1 Tax=Papaver somniferum TaxID=3469 RepID=A0A4Y7KGT0_PAPSO|nr:hypothetical protein C5167_048048 [Papaver somniferum]